MTAPRKSTEDLEARLAELSAQGVDAVQLVPRDEHVQLLEEVIESRRRRAALGESDDHYRVRLEAAVAPLETMSYWPARWVFRVAIAMATGPALDRLGAMIEVPRER